MSIYELGILGTISADERGVLETTLASMINEFELTLDRDVIIHDASTICRRDKRAAFAAAYFCGPVHLDVEATRDLVSSSAPIIPAIGVGGDFGAQIPNLLQLNNGLRRRTDDPNMTELAAAMLECVGLLRRQRHVFVSYRRIESRTAALQLHDLLTARGFDVFLDTHSIRPGDLFQDILWNRLCDADVLVMLDTPSYFDSRWTREEIGRARAKDIQVLRIVWPEHKPSKLTDLSETIYLEASELAADDGPIANDRADQVVLSIESLRSRSIAARYMAITGKLRADLIKIGASVEGIGAHRAIAVRLLDDRVIWAYPIVGVPTAELLYDIADKARRASQGEVPVLVYDHVGIRDAWSAHLRWLDKNIKSVRAIKVSEAGWELAAWSG